MSGPPIHVVAGVLTDSAGRVLIARRPGGVHLGGLWEFPGGKLGPGESREAGLERELTEELGVRVVAAHPLIWVEHRYPDRDVVLDVWSVESYSGRPFGREGQPVEWRDVRSLDPAEFPPADLPVLSALRLPRRYLVTPEPGPELDVFLDRLSARVEEGFDLVQLRAKSLGVPALVDLGRRAAEICRRGGATLLVNAEPEVAQRCGAGGVHLAGDRLERMLRTKSVPGGDALAALRGSFGPVDAMRTAGGERLAVPAASPMPRPFLVGTSCHDAGDLSLSRAAGCDFAVLGPVRETATHPSASTLGWEGFERLARGAGLPVFAIGGLREDDIAAASRNGAQGVAAIRAFWGEI